MRKLLIALVAALLFTANVAAAPTFNPLQVRQHRAAHMIVLKSDTEKGQCSATAVSPNTLLTAQHCYIPNAQVYVDTNPVGHQIASTVGDDHDTLLIVLADAAVFSDYLPMPNPATYVGPVQGEMVYFWGNPAGKMDVYRFGYMAGAFPIKGDDIAPGSPVQIAVMVVIPGDSGAAIFGDDGRLLGVVTYGISNQFLGFYPLHFSAKQLRQAGL